eukprot:CAMPEP_0119205646 /NCGR_PEP_ID=MMETSP1316-20130426/39989_1 /TAXON_ID=41880 /ORGANISM="Pycnococcus provasolii, Strain RCC2336" /LENGTH=99 /DNA_ID=CAMNT_0007202035 /DNA_START=106 /DNA_END=405 /DNA_ORIENTATION=+
MCILGSQRGQRPSVYKLVSTSTPGVACAVTSKNVRAFASQEGLRGTSTAAMPPVLAPTPEGSKMNLIPVSANFDAYAEQTREPKHVHQGRGSLGSGSCP